MTLEEYLRSAINDFRVEEEKEYAPDNVKRDVLAVNRFVDFILGKYKGKAGER